MSASAHVKEKRDSWRFPWWLTSYSYKKRVQQCNAAVWQSLHWA